MKWFYSLKQNQLLSTGIGMGKRNKLSFHQTECIRMLMDKLFAVLSVLYNLQSCKIAQRTIWKSANPLSQNLERCSLDQRMTNIFCKEWESNSCCHLFILLFFFLKLLKIETSIKSQMYMPWLVWLSWLGVIRQSEGLAVWFPGLVPGWGMHKRQLINVSLN